ncbi:MAG TPA: thioredoxin domain-containing protein [Candidatus Saccharimonadales bacterium]|nr:thioredoxin domain-containing protein [Candidatus Saccharimonadales bacterium]
MSKGFLAIIAIVVLVFIGIFAFSGHDKSNSANKSSSSKGTPTSHVEGKGQSGVTLVEYGDYQCPYCEQYYPIVKQVAAEFNDQIKFQFRNFPLVSIHQNAFAGARAAEAAAAQGKFWQMHDLLYENQSQWSESSNPTQFFQQYAKQLGLNVAQFNKDYSSNAVNNAINADTDAGNKLKVQGTPTFFLNGKQIQVNADAGSFETQIKQAIQQKKS